ncbi:MAG TPA: class I SAM-dependent methyltransferase [Polyangiaceae bacterium]|nr:class I SAM-dependent methyltransferase [Polyangiaceae bacterium]
MPRSPFLSEAVRSYLVASVGEEPELLQQLRQETRAATEFPGMQIGPDQGRFLALLLELLGAQRAIEVGVFTGYSSICIARALPPHGKLIACDVSDEWTSIARRYWQQAGVSDRIDLRLGPALQTLEQLVGTGGVGTFDFAFIDADKGNYDGYYELCLTLLRPGGLIAVDNALWGGSVADAADQRPDTLAIRTLNAKAFGDARVTASLVPVGDGVLLVRKR